MAHLLESPCPLEREPLRRRFEQFRVDPTRGAEPDDVERVFHIVQSGERLLLTVAGFAAVGYRLLGGDCSPQREH